MSSKTIDSSISAGQYDLYTCTVSTGKNIICQKLNIPVCSLKPKLANCTRQENDLVRDYRTVQYQYMLETVLMQVARTIVVSTVGAGQNSENQNGL